MNKATAAMATGNILLRWRPLKKIVWETEDAEGVHRLMGIYLPKFEYTVRDRDRDKQLAAQIPVWKAEGKIKTWEA